MTDKQIAMAIIVRRSWGWIIDNDEIRDQTGQKTSEARCDRVRQKVIELIDQMRLPMIEKLASDGIDCN